ncbi:MAG: cytochrome P450, partial [Bacteroidota bacterium]
MTLAGPPRSRNPVTRVRDLLRLVRDPLGTVQERFDAYGDVYAVDEGGGRRLLVTRHPDAIRSVLVTHAGSFQKSGGANDRLKAVLGDGLLVADGEVWRRKRRLVQPAFRAKAIASYAATMVQHAEDVQWSEAIDLSGEMMRLTLGIVCKALFDHDVRGDTDTVARAMEALREASQPDPWPAFVPTPRRLRARRAMADIDTLIASLVATRAPGDGHTDLLALLQAAGLTGRELRDELVTLFLAGHETTSHALTWALWLVAEHPEVRDQLE